MEKGFAQQVLDGLLLSQPLDNLLDFCPLLC